MSLSCTCRSHMKQLYEGISLHYEPLRILPTWMKGARPRPRPCRTRPRLGSPLPRGTLLVCVFLS
eukprot:6851637-Prorocentrum_lima.AAC.1